MQEVRYGTEPAGSYAFLLGNGNENQKFGKRFLYTSRVESKQFVSDSMMLRRWIDISALIMRVHTRIIDDTLDSLFE
jgi:hypothetical protein